MIGVPKISYSLLASIGKQQLSEAVALLPGIGVDLIHYDVSEEQKTLSLADIEPLRPHTTLPFDVHLAVKDPAKYTAGVKMQHGDYFCIHVENNYDLKQLKQLKEQLGCYFGLAINVETPVEALDYAVPIIDFVLFMAATPGVSGGSFNDAVIDKMQKFHERYRHIKMHVDGGVNNMSAALLRDLGVDVMISGSYILKDNDYSKQVARLIGQNLNLPVSMMMHAGLEFPKVYEKYSIGEICREIDDKRIGCACVFSEDDRYTGLITDTDVRRYLIKQPDLTHVTAKDVMNPHSFTIEPDTSVIKLIRALEKKGMFFTVVPIVEKSGRCIGVLRLQDIVFSNVLGLRIRN